MQRSIKRMNTFFGFMKNTILQIFSCFGRSVFGYASYLEFGFSADVYFLGFIGLALILRDPTKSCNDQMICYFGMPCFCIATIMIFIIPVIIIITDKLGIAYYIDKDAIQSFSHVQFNSI